MAAAQTFHNKSNLWSAEMLSFNLIVCLKILLKKVCVRAVAKGFNINHTRPSLYNDIIQSSIPIETYWKIISEMKYLKNKNQTVPYVILSVSSFIIRLTVADKKNTI